MVLKCEGGIVMVELGSFVFGMAIGICIGARIEYELWRRE